MCVRSPLVVLRNKFHRSDTYIHLFYTFTKTYLGIFPHHRFDNSLSKFMVIDSLAISKICNIIFYHRFLDSFHSWFFSHLGRDIWKGIKRKSSTKFYFFDTVCRDFSDKSTGRISYIVSKIQSFFGSSNKKIFSCSGHRNVHQSAFFFELFWILSGS